jgi:hypothetical protein
MPSWSSQDALESGQYWQHEGGEPFDVTADDLTWSYEPAFPVARLISFLGGPEDWLNWMMVEVNDRGVDWFWSFSEWWVNKPTEQPVVLVLNPDGTVDGIWDGWHRCATSVLFGARSLPAFVGRRASWPPYPPAYRR